MRPGSQTSAEFSSKSVTSHRAELSVARVEVADDLHHRASMSSTPSQKSPIAGMGDSASPRKKKGITRTVSSFLKNLFVTKPSDSGTVIEGPLSGPSSPSSKSFSAGKMSLGEIKNDLANNRRSITKPQTSTQGSSAAQPAPPAPSQAQALPKKLPAQPHPPSTPQNPPRNSIAAKEGASSILLSVAKVLPPNMARPVWCLKDYAIVEKMYTGYASTVYKAWCKASGETVCLKAYNMANLCELNRYQIYREVKLHSSLQHENIITLYGAFQQGDQVVLVQEFADSGDLFLLLHRYGGKLPERTAVELVLHPFLCVLNYLHQNCVVHRDIKPENVLFTRTMQLKLCDFGLAIDLREERAVTRAGTLEYMAPEVLDCPFKNKPEENKEKENLHYTLTVDTWAVGVLTYELLVGFPPFNDKQRAAIEEKIRSDTPRFPSSMSELGRNFILRTLQKDAIERPTIMELITHPWIRAHRRNASMRSLGATPNNGKQRLRPSGTHVAVQEDEEEEVPDKQTKAAAAQEMRTQDGDLLQAMPSYASFTAGSNRPKLPMMQEKPKHSALGPVRDVGVTGMSFSTSQNPKLQALKHMM